MLRLPLCDYSDAYIALKGTVDLLAAAANENDKAEKDVAFKNNAPFRSCISKTNSTLIDNADDLGIVMPMYNLLEYGQNYSMTSGILWNYYRDKIDDADDNASNGNIFEYKTEIVGKTPDQKDLEMKEMQIDHQYQSYMLKSLFQSYILVLSGDLLICHWQTVK